MEYEATMKFVTNLDRAGIEARLHEIAQKAAACEHAGVARRLAVPAGKSGAQLNALIMESIAELSGKDDARRLVDELEMVQINLPNLG